MDQMTIQTVVLAIIGIISASSIPWAFVIERRMARIESKISNGIVEVLNRQQVKLDQITDRVTDLEVNAARKQ